MGFTKVSAHSNADARKSFIADIRRSFDGYNIGGHRLHGIFDDAIKLLKMGLASVMAGCTLASMAGAMRPIILGCALFVFMKLEYTMDMVMPGAEPRDVGFQYTTWLHHMLANHPLLNGILAACNTAFVVFQAGYVIWTFFVNRRKRPVIAALFMYTFRAFLGYATQLPVPQEFLGSGFDFPVNNTSFFLFFSGHVAGSVIVSVDMRRMQLQHFGFAVEIANILQSLRLLATRGHYTIDLVIGAGAGWVCDLLASKYEEIEQSLDSNNVTNGAKLSTI